jgi:alpha-tubulin suppressor-like RCC1 family protein
VSVQNKNSIIGLLLFIAMFGGINGWFIYKRSTAPKVELFSSNQKNNSFTINTSIRSTDIAKIQNGNGFVLILLKNGSVYGSGNHTKGQLGIGPQAATPGQLYPVLFDTTAKIVDISSSDSHSVALDADGGVWAWGLNISGQIGNNSHQNQTTPTRVLENAQSITAGYRFSAAASKNGELFAWGMSCDQNNPEFDKILQEFAANATAGGSYYGGVDSGDTQDCINEQNLPIASITPRRIEDISNVKQLSGGYGHLLWLTDAGQLWSWGCNQYAQLGREKTFNSQNTRTPAPVTSVKDKTFSQISAGFRHSTAIDNEGVIWAWGHNGATEVNSTNEGSVQVPTKVSTSETASNVSAGFDATVIQNKSGALLAVGDNTARRLVNSDNATVRDYATVTPQASVFVLGRDSILYTDTLND